MICSLQGEADTKEYRQFVQHEGKDVSAWHDIPLQNEDGSFNFVCEIPKETSAKMEVATVSAAVFSVYNNAAVICLHPGLHTAHISNLVY